MLAALVVAGLLAFGAGGASAAEDDGARTPTQLWEQFPLGDPVPTTPAADPPAPPPPPPVASTPPVLQPPVGAGNDGVASLDWLAVLLVVLVASSAVVLLGRPALRRRGARATPARNYDMFLAQLAQWKGGPFQPSEEIIVDERQTPMAVESSEATGRVDVGGRVNQILSAAEEAAEQYRNEKNAEADVLLRDARAEAAAISKKAEEKHAELVEAAETAAAETRSQGDVYATQRRRQADDEAGRVLADGEQQARAIREAAEAMAAQIENDARDRIRELEEQAKELEIRLGRAVGALRSTASQLENVLGVERKPERSPETLIEALDVAERTLESA